MEKIMTTDDVAMPIENFKIVDSYEEMPIDDYYGAPVEKSGISSTTILWIVVSICAIVGIVLGIIVGKKTANK